MELNSLAGHFFVITDVFFLKKKREARTFSRPFCPNLRFFVLLVSTMLGLRAWGDDLNVVLFECLDDDTQLAQSCTDWLYVQHWYTVVPQPSMRVTLWALMGVGDDCDKRTQDTSPHFFFFSSRSDLRHHCAVVHICVVLRAIALPDDRCHRGKPASMRHDGLLCDVDQHILAHIVCGFGWHSRTFVFAPCNCPYQAWFALLAG